MHWSQRKAGAFYVCRAIKQILSLQIAWRTPVPPWSWQYIWPYWLCNYNVYKIKFLQFKTIKIFTEEKSLNCYLTTDYPVSSLADLKFYLYFFHVLNTTLNLKGKEKHFLHSCYYQYSSHRIKLPIYFIWHGIPPVKTPLNLLLLPQLSNHLDYRKQHGSQTLWKEKYFKRA